MTISLLQSRSKLCKGNRVDLPIQSAGTEILNCWKILKESCECSTDCGRMAEWPIAPALKAGVPARGP